MIILPQKRSPPRGGLAAFTQSFCLFRAVTGAAPFRFPLAFQGTVLLLEPMTSFLSGTGLDDAKRHPLSRRPVA